MTSPMERQNEVFLGVHSTFFGPQKQPPTNDMAGVEQEPGPAQTGVVPAPSAVRIVRQQKLTFAQTEEHRDMGLDG